MGKRPSAGRRERQPPIDVEHTNPQPPPATNPRNYLLFGSTGGGVGVDSVSLDATGKVATLSYNGGNPLVLDTYTLLVRGDQLKDVDDNLPVARPGQFVVANGGRNNV